ncbi:unnamed protein product [Tenebrio molitor]|nr:unnamed protein product [Tenebrio molitor]
MNVNWLSINFQTMYHPSTTMKNTATTAMISIAPAWKSNVML